MCLEILDIVNEKDEIVSQLDRETIYRRKLNCFRTINAFLVNSAFQIWIPVRHPSKEYWPLHLDASIGGHLKTGESYKKALIREGYEELSLQINSNSIIYLGKLNPHKDGVNSFMKVFLIKQEISPHYNPHDFIWGGWFSFSRRNLS